MKLIVYKNVLDLTNLNWKKKKKSNRLQPLLWSSIIQHIRRKKKKSYSQTYVIKLRSCQKYIVLLPKRKLIDGDFDSILYGDENPKPSIAKTCNHPSRPASNGLGDCHKYLPNRSRNHSLKSLNRPKKVTIIVQLQRRNALRAKTQALRCQSLRRQSMPRSELSRLRRNTRAISRNWIFPRKKKVGSNLQKG